MILHRLFIDAGMHSDFTFDSGVGEFSIRALTMQTLILQTVTLDSHVFTLQKSMTLKISCRSVIQCVAWIVYEFSHS